MTVSLVGLFIVLVREGREREREEETWGRKKKNIKMKQSKNKTINIWCIVK